MTDTGTLVTIGNPLQVTGSIGFNNGTSAASLVVETGTSAAGSNPITNDATGSFTAAWYRYTIKNGGNARAGTINAVWNGASYVYDEVSTTDIGTTTSETFSIQFTTGSVQLVYSSAGGWAFKAQTTFL
jgi:hypothetical protein